MNEDKRLYLQLIQNIIDRMADNSFKVKGWAIGVMLAIFSFASNQGDKRCILFTVVPLFVLWFLDTYYLQLERKYRLFYNIKRNLKNDENLYDMNYNNIKIEMEETNKICFIRCMFSLTEVLFYITCIATSVVVYLI